MKKVLAFLCSIAVFSVSLFGTGIFSQNAVAESSGTEKRFFQSFATEADYAASKKYVNVAGTNINLEYDAAEGALKASPKQTGISANHQVRIDPTYGSTTVKVDEYPVIAVKIKFNNSGGNRFGGVNVGTNKASRPSGSTDSVFSTSVMAGMGKTGDWQLPIWDGTSKVYNADDSTTNKNFCGTYEALLCCLTDNGKTVTADDFCYIQWAGAFKSVEEVYEYEQEMVSPYFYDFTDKDITEKTLTAQNKRVGNDGKNNTLSYDAEEGALKIDATDGQTNAGWFCPMPYLTDSTKVSSYPVVAFKIKVNNTTNAFDRLFLGTAGRTVSGGNYNNDFGVIGDKPTGAWQIVVFDGTKLVYDANDSSTNQYFDGTYGNMIIKLMSDSTVATSEDIWWIQWAGVFKTVEDVYAYADMPNTSFFYDFTEEDNTIAYIGSGRVADDSSNMTFSYDKTNEALKVSSKADSKANRFRINPSATTSVSDNSVVAIKFKVSNPQKNFGGIAPMPNHGDNNNTARPYGYINSTFPYGYLGSKLTETGDWQIVCIDMKTFSDQTYVKGTWNGLLVAAIVNGTAAAEGDCIYVQWAGVFKTEKEVYSYDREVSSPSVYNYTEGIKSGTANKGIVINGDKGLNGSVAYSTEYTALKVTANDSTSAVNHRLQINNQMGDYDQNSRVNAKNHPVIAVKIRADVESQLTVWAGIRKIKSGNNNGSDYTDNDKITSSVKVDGDWKIITFDYTEKINNYITTSGNDGCYWTNWLLLLTPDNTAAPEGQEWDIQWFGIFDSEESAFAYDSVYFEDVAKSDNVSPSADDINVLFVGNGASELLLADEVKEVIGKEKTDINIGYLTSDNNLSSVSNGTDNMKFKYMGSDNGKIYTDEKTNTYAVKAFADWDYIFAEAGSDVSSLVTAAAKLTTNGKAVPYTAAANADTSSFAGTFTDLFDLNGTLYKAATHYVSGADIYTQNSLTSSGKYLAGLALCEYLIADYEALDKDITVYGADKTVDFLIKASVNGSLAGDADGSGTIDVSDIQSVRAHIIGTQNAANTGNADSDHSGTVDILDMVRLNAFLNK